MRDELTLMPLADAPLEIIDGDRGSNYPHQNDFHARGHCLFLNAGNVTSSGFNFSDCAFISAEKDASLRKGKLSRGDVVLTTRGTVGNAAYFDEFVQFENIRINSGMVILRADASRLLPRFLYLFARSPLFQEQIRALRTGSAQPQLPIRDIIRIKIPIPRLEEQRAISYILGTLDDKIELNRRMSETLEAIARAIFKSWFVDFDPVIDNALRAGNPIPTDLAEKAARRREMLARAKADGRDSCFPQHIAALFPDRFVDSELGPIPAGWDVKTVGSEVEIVKGVSYRSKELLDSDTALVTLKSFNRGGGYRPDGLKPYIGPYKPEQEIQPGELIVAQTDVTQAAEVIGKPALVLPDSRFRMLAASLDVLIIRPTKPDLAREFFYLLFLTPEFQEHVYAHTNGTTVLHLSKTGVPSFRFARPPGQIGRGFLAFAVPLFGRIVSNVVESRILAALRDALLPKLISGELRVKDAERIIAEVTT